MQCRLDGYNKTLPVNKQILKSNKIIKISSIIVLASILFFVPAQISEASTKTQPITLSWDYFQESNNNILKYDAFLSYGTAREWTWEKMDSVECSFQLTSMKSKTIVFSEKSWVKEDKKSDELLNHEQRHLDIREIFNREGNNEFQKIMSQEFECSNNDSNGDIEIKVNKIVMNFFNSFEQKHVEFQEKYDHAVDHGLNKDVQNQWDQKIECMLENDLRDKSCDLGKI